MAVEYEEFGPYAVYECLGTGGMATVHRAMYDDGELVREVALKRLLPQHENDKTFVDDFVREGKLAARLSHPSIVRIFELGRINQTYFIAMQLVVGQPLMQLIRTAHYAKKQTPIGVVIALISELCDALDYASNGSDRETGERLNIVHRDLSPSNLLITDDGHLKIIDFGVAKATAGARFTTSTGLVKGKLGYMSVESLSGKDLDGRSDVFSVGVVAWELVTGRRLFTGKSEYEVIQRVREGSVPPPSAHNTSCPPTLDSIILQALARSRDERWQTAGAMRQAIETIRRAYREDATPELVVAWMQKLVTVTTPPPSYEGRVERPDSDSEATQYRERPSGPPVRHHTMIDLVEEEAVAAVINQHTAVSQPSPAATGAMAQGTGTASYEPFNAFDDEGTQTEAAFDSPPTRAQRTFDLEGEETSNASETYMELAVMSDEPSLRFLPIEERRSPNTAVTVMDGAPSTTTSAPQTLEMLSLDETREQDVPEDMLELEEPAPPQVELLDLEAIDPPTTIESRGTKPPARANTSDTVVVKRGG